MGRIAFSCSDDLAEAAEILRKRHQYRSMSEFMVVLLRFECQTQSEHLFSGPMACLQGYEKDKLDADLLAAVKEHRPLKWSAIRRMIVEALEIATERGGKVDVEVVLEEMKRRGIEKRK